MSNLFLYLARRFRPAEGWMLVLLALAAVLCVQQAAASAQLPLPDGAIGWAGVLGLLIGRWIAGKAEDGERGAKNERRKTKHEGRRTEDGRQGSDSVQQDSNTPVNTALPRRQTLVLRPTPVSRLLSFVRLPSFLSLRVTLALILGLFFFTLAVGKALPPPALVWRDGTTVLAAARQRLTTRAIAPETTPTPATTVPAQPPVPLPEERPVVVSWGTIAFLQEALPRFWGELRAAPNAGERGASLIASLASALLTWAGALLLGVGLRRRRNMLGWGVPLLLALATTKLLGGGSSVWLFMGLGLLLLLALLTVWFQRERSWALRQIDYATDIRLDVLMWGVMSLALVLLVAAALPFALDNPLSQLLWAQFEPPSAFQALERHIEQGQRPQTAPVVRLAGSTLPEVELGVSLEEAADDQVALRIHTGQPISPGPWPHYWRSRVLNIYTGSTWRSNALITPEPGLNVPAGTQLNLIEQDVEDPRPNRSLVYGLPNVIGISVDTNSERLSDGSLAANTLLAPADAGPQRYRVFSNPPEQVPPAPPEEVTGQPKPDMSSYLRVPGNMPLRVADLARALTRDATTPTDKALALESYLRGLPYSYEVAPLPEAGDAVDQFLFNMRQGYCTYYASSFALLARTLGIPARISIGYYTGTYDAASGSYVVYERDAHAWPELYLDGRWLPFEPTPVRPLPARSGKQTTEPTPLPAPVPEPVPTLPEQLWTYVPGIAVVLVLVLALLAPLLPRYVRRTGSPQEIQRQLERRGARAGLPWPEGATLHEYGLLLRPHLDGSAHSLDTLVTLIEEARYSGHGLTSDQQGRLLMAWNAVRQRLRHAVKR